MKRSFALALSLGLFGCAPPTPEEVCRGAFPNPAIRDAHFQMLSMQHHRDHLTLVSLAGEPQPFTDPMTGETTLRSRVRARASISPSVAASSNYIVSAGVCTSMDDMEMHFIVPAFLPPDDRSGPYHLEIGSDMNGDRLLTSRTRDGSFVDHTWRRPICDDGNVMFTHNTGFDELDAVATGADFQLEMDEADLALAVIPVNASDSAADAAAKAAARTAMATRLRPEPMVVELNTQGTTVGYIRSVRACDANPVELRGVVVPGEYRITVYWDLQRNGLRDAACDPTCTFTAVATSPWIFEPTEGALALACNAPTNANFVDECRPTNR